MMPKISHWKPKMEIYKITSFLIYTVFCFLVNVSGLRYYINQNIIKICNLCAKPNRDIQV